MAQPGWAPKKKQGEAKGDYQKRFYSAQREHAEETGDQATTDKIYKKLGKPSHSVDADAVNKKALAYGPALAAGGAVGLGRLGAGAAASAATKALARGGAQKALGSGLKTATKVTKPAGKLPGSASRLPAAAQKALPSGRSALPVARASQAVPKAPAQRALPSGGAKRAPSTDKPRTYNSTGASSSRTAQIKTTGRNMARAKRSGASENSNMKYGKSKPKAKKGGR